MKVLDVQSGTSAAGKEWKKQEFVFEYFEHETDRYSDKVVLSLMGDNIEKYALVEGEAVTIGFSHNIDEYQGKYYNRLRMYHFARKEAKEVSGVQGEVESEGGDKKLPF